MAEFNLEGMAQVPRYRRFVSGPGKLARNARYGNDASDGVTDEDLLGSQQLIHCHVPALHPLSERRQYLFEQYRAHDARDSGVIEFGA